jgi:hypothetical protein
LHEKFPLAVWNSNRNVAPLMTTLLELLGQLMTPEQRANREAQKEQLRQLAEKAALRPHVQSREDLVVGGLYRNDVDAFLVIVGREDDGRFFYSTTKPSNRGGRLHYVVDDENSGSSGLGRENHNHWCKLSRMA